MSPPLGLGKKCPARVAYKVDQPPPETPAKPPAFFVPWLKRVPLFCDIGVVLLDFSGAFSAFQADWILDLLLLFFFFFFVILFFWSLKLWHISLSL